MQVQQATTKYRLGDVVRHRDFPFRGVVYDVDPKYDHTEEFWEAIPEQERPSRDQPFYHLLAENEASFYMAYVPEQFLVLDDSEEPIEHPVLDEFFVLTDGGKYTVAGSRMN